MVRIADRPALDRSWSFWLQKRLLPQSRAGSAKDNQLADAYQYIGGASGRDSEDIVVKNPNVKIKISNQAQSPKSKKVLSFGFWI